MASKMPAFLAKKTAGGKPAPGKKSSKLCAGCKNPACLRPGKCVKAK